MIRILLPIACLFSTSLFAQTKKPAAKPVPATTTEASVIPISNAELGQFPYFKTLPNFQPTDSITIEQNRTWFYDGQKFFSIDGKVSIQNQNVQNSDLKLPSIFQVVQEFDKVVATLGGKKIFEGRLPEDPLKKAAGDDIVSLGSKHQVVPSAYYGIVEHVIKTPEKEVWIQLQPNSLLSKFYTLLVVEKQTQLITTNINKENVLLQSLEKTGKATTHFEFSADSTDILTQSRDELLNIVGIFQAHPDWKIKIEVHNAPVGKPEYTRSLTDRRAAAIRQELLSLGVKAASVTATGLGDQQPLLPNESEKNRWFNTRVEISKI
ncbi:MAG: OmpA family protein [Bacteroidetes bacterium]|nr:OmpA family protein [Bacteroidota bacterium]